ncbi:MAG: PEP-CTERM sorting domain-containing protein [Microcystis aeruginosa G13-07]|nr:PEP-CTERM sorting domain-containing protein [Microcystis aeruginosa G13-11]NCS08756.1 PEP-CTERM sorting domain-containing protein [Microcystis aeruginosa G13-07]
MNFNKIILVTGLAVSGIALSGVFAPAHAAFFQNTFGLSDSHSTITFGLQDYPDGTPITNQYQNQGVVFSPNVFYFSNNGGSIVPPTPPVFVGAVVTNFIPHGDTVGSVVISFTQPQTEAAFAVGTQSGTTTYFEAFLGTNLVDSSGATNADSLSNDFFGFSGITFDSIKISGSVRLVFALDNIQLPTAPASSSVPEPSSTLGLLAFGTLGAGAILKRKIKPSKSTGKELEKDS